MKLIRLVLIAAVLALGATACGDPVKQAKTAAQLRGQVEMTLQSMEMRHTVPGLAHRHVTVEPDADSDGFLVKIYDLKLGAAAIGFQSFKTTTFVLTEKPATEGSSQTAGFSADRFRFDPRAVGETPDTAPGMLIGQMKRWAAEITLQN
jgi:hypothetical protein